MPTVQFFQPHEGRQFDGQLDLNEHLIRHPAATFFMRAGSDSLREIGIKAGDLLIVDRSDAPAIGKVVAVVRSGEIRLETFRIPTTEDELEIWGVVTHSIRQFP